jgi:hypothetical protein
VQDLVSDEGMRVAVIVVVLRLDNLAGFIVSHWSFVVSVGSRR